MRELENLYFNPGQTLKASDLNLILANTARVAERHGIQISSINWFENGQVLKADQLNTLRNNISQLYRFWRGSFPDWSFENFRDGDVLEAKHLNELIKMLQIANRYDK